MTGYILSFLRAWENFQFTPNVIANICIGLLGVTAIMLSQSKDKSKVKWACVFGLLGQPFWFYTSWYTGNWGIFALSFMYTWAWLVGVNTHWLVPFLEKLAFNKRAYKDVYNVRLKAKQ